MKKLLIGLAFVVGTVVLFFVVAARYDANAKGILDSWNVLQR